MIQIGTVSEANLTARTIRVYFPDKNNMVSDELQLLTHVPLPDIGENVVCIFLSNGTGAGFCVGALEGGGG